MNWINDPYESSQSSRAQIDEAIGQAEEILKEFSYNQWTLDLDVCEVSPGTERSLAGIELMNESIRLCDPTVNYNDYDLLFLYPNDWAGGYYRGRITFETDDGEVRPGVITMGYEGFGERRVVHETGHYLLLRHAHSVECGDNVFGPGCFQFEEYGDWFDTMGHAHMHYNAAYKEQIGWASIISGSATCGDTPTFTIGAMEVPSDAAQGILLPIDNSLTHDNFTDDRVTSEACDNLYIEYRKPIGYDEARLYAYLDAGYYSSMTDGVLALHCVASTSRRHAWLLDCTPNSRSSDSSDFKDALLPLGETCATNLGYDVSFTLSGWNKADVRVERTAAYISPIFPPEICGDGIDNNCDGSFDEGCNDDGDWYCDASMTTFGEPPVCPNGGGDCDDNDASIHPGGIEYCNGRDDDCDGSVNEGGVCPEVCDGADNDGDGATDEGCNQDGDAYCGAGMPVVGLPAVCPSGGGDCDDSDASRNPGVAEICDGIDNNCSMSPDGVWVDEGGVCPAVSCTDSDGGNNPVVGGSVVTSTGGPTPVTETLSDFCEEGGWVLTEFVCMPVLGGGSRGFPVSGGCPPGLWCINPGGGLPSYCGAGEICDGIDNNTEGTVDEGCDDDSDNYCDATMTTDGTPAVCPNGGGDSDDANAAVNPGATEICDGIDNNAEGTVDEGCDDDNDNYCDATMTTVGTPAVCPNGGGDCGDGNLNTHPGGRERCDDRIDNDCDGSTEDLTICSQCSDSDGGNEPQVGGVRTIISDTGATALSSDSCIVYNGSVVLLERICSPFQDSRTVSLGSRINCSTYGQVCTDPDGEEGPEPAYCAPAP